VCLRDLVFGFRNSLLPKIPLLPFVLHYFQHQNTLFFAIKYKVYLIYPAPCKALYFRPGTEGCIKISTPHLIKSAGSSTKKSRVLRWGVGFSSPIPISENGPIGRGGIKIEHGSSFPFKEVAMKCHRCGGAMVYEKFYGICEFFWGWRCIFCGEIVDQVILENRPNIPRLK
jgi:hypothetical protein